MIRTGLFKILLFLLLPLTSISQVDSLLQRWTDLEEDQSTYLEKAELAFKISDYYISRYPAKSFFYSKKYLEFSRAAHDTDHIFQAYANLGINCYYLGNMKKALSYFREFYEFAKKTGRDDGIGMATNNLANIYMDMGLEKLAISYLKKSLFIYKQTNNKNAQAYIYNNLGNAYSMEEKYDSSLMFFNKSLDLKRELGDEPGQANTLNNIGELYQKWGNYPKALDNFSSSLEIKTRHDDFIGMAGTLESTGLVYQQLHDYSKAINAFNKSLFIAREHNIIKYISSNLKNLSDTWANLNDYKKSYYFLSEYVSYQDSGTTGRDTMLMPDVKLTSQLEEKDRKIALLNKQLDSNKNSDKTSQKILVISGVIILILLLLLLAYYLSLKKYKQTIRDKEQETADLTHNLNRLNQIIEGLQEKVIEKEKALKLEQADKKRLQNKMTEALDKAERMNKLKTEFLANISHEIRTPLNGVIGFTDLLTNELEDSETPYLYEYAREAYESGMRLLNLLNNIIDISRFEANDFEITPTPINAVEIVKNVFELYRFAANDKGLRYELIESNIPTCLGDKDFLSKSFSNILDNAIKYTPEGTVSVGMGHIKEQDEIFFRISDTGVGISPDYLPHVFDSFSQESTGPTRKFQGSGLGLALTKKFVDAIGGRLEIESDKDEGTRVTIYLKTTTTKAPKKLTEKYIRKEIGKKKLNIFIVEDNEMNAYLLKTMLKNHANVIVCEDGDDSLSVIEGQYNDNKIFDLMLFDINLPYPWDGMSLMNEVKRRWKEYKNIPFVAQTAYAHKGDKERFLESGFDAYVPKPIDKKEFFNTLAEQLDIKFKDK